MKKILLSFAAILMLGGCVSQTQADEKMAKGCEAGIKSLLGSATIKEVKSINYSTEENIEGPHRRVSLETVTKDGWLETDKTYSCLFGQQWGLFKSKHLALLVQIKFPDGRIVGKKDGTLVGEIADFLNLTKTVDIAMGQN